MKHLLLTLLFVPLLTLHYASAQSPCEAETREYPAEQCVTGPVTPNTPLMDGNSGDYGDPDHNVISLYGSYGRDEQTPGPALNPLQLWDNTGRLQQHSTVGLEW